LNRHREERFLRRGNPDVIDILRNGIAEFIPMAYRGSQRRLKDICSGLLDPVVATAPDREGKEEREGTG
jgi:hypothetical protein